VEYPIAPGPPLGGPGLAAPARAQIIPFGCGSNGQINDHAAAQNGGSARSYLTLSTLATVLQSWDGHPHHWLAMPHQHGFLSLRWPFSTMAVLPGPPALRG